MKFPAVFIADAVQDDVVVLMGGVHMRGDHALETLKVPGQLQSDLVRRFKIQWIVW